MTELDKKLILEVATKAVASYAETHPRPSSVNLGQACKMIKKTRPTLSKLIASGVIKLNKLGEIPISEIDKVIAARV